MSKWTKGRILTTTEVVTNLVHHKPMYFLGKWYHFSFIWNWTFIYIRNRAMQGAFREAIRKEED